MWIGFHLYLTQLLALALLSGQKGRGNDLHHPTSWRQVTAAASTVVWEQNHAVAHAPYLWASLLPWVSSPKPEHIRCQQICGGKFGTMGDANYQLSSFFFLYLAFSKTQQLNDVSLETSSESERSASYRAVVSLVMISFFILTVPRPSLMALSPHSFLYSWIRYQHISLCLLLSFLGNPKKAKAQHNS